MDYWTLACRTRPQQQLALLTSRSLARSDDMLSGCQIVNNTFEEVQIGILLGGSRDVLIANNRFTNVTEWAITVDNRGPGFDQYLCAYNSSFIGRFAKVRAA